MNARTAISAALILSFLLLSCANELSEEKKVRENSDREYDRLSKAAGVYTGHIAGPDGMIVPASVNVLAQKNPSSQGEKPSLMVALRIGLFGGVTVTSTAAIYDFGTKQLSASFSKGGATNTGQQKQSPGDTSSTPILEFRAVVDNDGLIDPVLVGAHQGIKKLSLTRADTDDGLFSYEEETKFLYFASGKKDGGADGVLTLKKRPEPQLSPPTADLPLFPGLDATVELDHFSISPEFASSVLYDPIQNTLDIYFSDVSHMELTGLFSSPADGGKHSIRPINGQILVKSKRDSSVLLKQEPLAAPLAPLPPTRYQGFFQAVPPDGPRNDAVVYLDYQGHTSQNTLQIPFLNFPDLILELDTCEDNDIAEKSFLELDRMDFLNHVGYFVGIESKDKSLDLTWTEDFQKINGIFKKTVGSGSNRPIIELSSVPEEGFKGCAGLRPPP